MTGEQDDDSCPDFVGDHDRLAWDRLSPERKQQYLDAVPYIREEYPEEKLSMVLIGTVLTFGG